MPKKTIAITVKMINLFALSVHWIRMNIIITRDRIRTNDLTSLLVRQSQSNL